MTSAPDTKKRFNLSPAIIVIILFGMISMLGDILYEGARSANSQYFNLIGINAAQVGLVFGIGEFLGYGLRLLSGVASDRSGNYWLFLFLGYGMLIVVPLIGFTQSWPLLVILILMERIGKALRNPAKDTIVSSVAENQVGTGFAFGLQEALDQLGAFLGPMIFTLVFFLTGKAGLAEYQSGYKWMFIPYLLLMLFIAFVFYRTERDNLIPRYKVREFRSEKLPGLFWLYMAFTFLCTLGFANFSLIGFHLKENNILSDAQITLYYSIAMIVDAITAVVVGKLYDQRIEKAGKKTAGLALLAFIPVVSLAMPLLALSHQPVLVALGMGLFGVILGAHETIMRSAIADITPFYKRGTSYGVFNAGYGLALMGGAALMGWLYDLQQMTVIFLFIVIIEVLSLAVYWRMRMAV